MSHADVGLCVVLFFMVFVALIITRGLCKVDKVTNFGEEIKYGLFIWLGLSAEVFLIAILFEVVSMSDWFTTLDMIRWSLVVMMVVVPLMSTVQIIFVCDYYGKNRRESTRSECEDSMWFVLYGLGGEVFLYLVWVGIS